MFSQYVREYCTNLTLIKDYDMGVRNIIWSKIYVFNILLLDSFTFCPLLHQDRNPVENIFPCLIFLTLCKNFYGKYGGFDMVL